jgi:hypothetical protein
MQSNIVLRVSGPRWSLSFPYNSEFQHLLIMASRSFVLARKVNMLNDEGGVVDGVLKSVNGNC